jgi:hypothetical protein
MLERDRHALTAGLLRVLKAAAEVSRQCLSSSASPSEWVLLMESTDLNAMLAWDGNVPFASARATLGRTADAATEHGYALFELARSPRSLSVPLATVTRGAVEAYGRVYYLLTAVTPEEFFGRYASIEYFDMDYPERFDARLRRLPHEVEATHPVDEYRKQLRDWMSAHNLELSRTGPTAVATGLLTAIYPDARAVYSGLSAAAHGQAWATANFFDFKKDGLRRDDKMLMEYCMYIIEAARLVGNLFIERFVPPLNAFERWKQTNGQVDASLAHFITPAHAPRGGSMS